MWAIRTDRSSHLAGRRGADAAVDGKGWRPCPARSSASTRTPTTRPCSSRGRWRWPRPKGDRVVVVVATAGEAGLTDEAHRGRRPARRAPDGRAAAQRRHARRRPGRVPRLRRLRAPARRRDDPPGDVCFVRADLDEAAERLADDPARGAGGRAHDVRRQRRLRAPGPRAGARRRAPGGRAGGHAGGAAGDGAPRPARCGRSGWPPRSIASRPSSTRRPSSAPSARRRRSPTGSTSAGSPTPSGPRWPRTPARPRAAAGTARWPAFIRMPRPLFRRVFGHEWFIQADLTPEQRAARAVPGPLRHRARPPWRAPWLSAVGVRARCLAPAGAQGLPDRADRLRPDAPRTPALGGPRHLARPTRSAPCSSSTTRGRSWSCASCIGRAGPCPAGCWTTASRPAEAVVRETREELGLTSIDDRPARRHPGRAALAAGRRDLLPAGGRAAGRAPARARRSGWPGARRGADPATTRTR